MFVIEDWVVLFKDNGRFERLPNSWFTSHIEAHQELRRLKAEGKVSKKAVVVLYPEEKRRGKMNAGDRAQVEDFLRRLGQMQAEGENVDTILQVVCDNLPDEERELIFRLKKMCGAHQAVGVLVLSG